MLGLLFFILGLAAVKIAAWQTGLLASITGTAQPDYTIAGLSFTAALIFFGLWLAGRIHKRETNASLLND
ncbi:MAG TPA: hypothetical protein VK308_07320 [Pyrinomonadaceae bacterium]|nr:hypothetical protein [Pyrinomonadaceae bacterium]